MTTYHTKNFYVNSSNSNLTTSGGFKFDTPTFFYKDTVKMVWNIQDENQDPVDLSGASFELKIAGTYSTTPLLTVDNGSFTAINITQGKMYCIADFNQADILTFLNLVKSKTAYASLWCSVGGSDYILANFTFNMRNIIF